jgi:hypothetical protein
VDPKGSQGPGIQEPLSLLSILSLWGIVYLIDSQPCHLPLHTRLFYRHTELVAKPGIWTGCKLAPASEFWIPGWYISI